MLKIPAPVFINVREKGKLSREASDKSMPRKLVKGKDQLGEEVLFHLLLDLLHELFSANGISLGIT